MENFIFCAVFITKHDTLLQNVTAICKKSFLKNVAVFLLQNVTALLKNATNQLQIETVTTKCVNTNFMWFQCTSCKLS